MNEFTFLLIAVVLTIFLLFSSKLLAKKGIITSSFARKFLHISSGIFIPFVPFYVDSYFAMILVGIFFTILNLFLIKKKLIKELDATEQPNLGILYFPFAFLILVLIFWQINKYIISFAFFIFALSDAMAAILGKSIKFKNPFIVHDEPKTIVGAIGSLITAFIVFFFLQILFFNKFNFISYTKFELLFIAILVSIMASIIELISTRGSDNFYVPISIGIMGFFFFYKGIIVENFVISFVLGAMIAFVSYRLKFLDVSGSLTTFILAIFILGLGGWKWTIPILSFFILSSILSKISDKLKKENFEEVNQKGGIRDKFQVLANGGLSLFFCLLNYSLPEYKFWYSLYILSLAVATSDTWATEIGTLLTKKVRLITNFKLVDRGISGGISVSGTIGGMVGGLIIVFLGSLFDSEVQNYFILLLFFSLIGNLVDSFLGATIQVKYICQKCGKITEKKEHCGINTSYYAGVSYVNNDLVNFLSPLFMSAIYFLSLII